MLQRFMKVELSRSTNFLRDSRAGRLTGENSPRTLRWAILNQKHSLISVSRAAGWLGAEECYASDTPVPTPLLLSLFRVARIGETRVLA